ncbi:MAG: isoprenyl transferase [Thermodesulfobacteriota bacterium]
MNSSRASHGTAPEASTLPEHVALIMDGNGRWAKKRLLNRIKGHEKGADTVRAVVEASRELGIRFLTLYAFSTENWQRSKSEIEALMILLRRFLVSEKEELVKNGIRLNAIGQLDRLPGTVQEALRETMIATREKNEMVLTLALSYGGRAEILKAVCDIARKVKTGELAPDRITESVFSDHLFTREIPDPEILIRTSGEMRISNFLLWQIAYTELFITPTLWPDFTREEFQEILTAFQQRKRRFGRTDD